MVAAAGRLGALGPPPPAAARGVPAGRAGSTPRPATPQVISHHYDVGNEFYRLVLGPSMTYSCARFVTPDTTLEEAQAAKHELICRKLGLDARPGARLLDVGCGWGSMAIHAARHHRATVVGVALSREQVDEARRRVAEAGLGDQVEIRLQDYRDLRRRAVRRHLVDRHVRTRRHGADDAVLRDPAPAADPDRAGCSTMPSPSRAVRAWAGGPSSAGTSSPTGSCSTWPRWSGPCSGPASRCGTSSRCASTTADPAPLGGQPRRHWDEAVALVGLARANIWRLYMAASANGFDDGGWPSTRCSGWCPPPTESSGMPPTRSRLGLSHPA